ncbi:EAL domain-containing protein [Francisella philomiragia]|uniref:bifunctional diguanylate cyclase/phosphodiesterase n=1 Tax=Francisella philomiragia TaxID=28110 RepID=UPI003519185F
MTNYLQKELYELIRSDKNIFDALQEASLDGIWYWDLENPENEWMSEKFWETLGFDPKEKKHLASEWQDLIHPDDLKHALYKFEKHLADPNYKYSLIVRYKHKNGSTVWIRCRGMAIRDKNGKPIRFLGVHNDITSLKETELILKDINNFSELMFNASEDIMFIKDSEYRIIKANQAMLNLYPEDMRDSIIGTTTVEKFDHKDAEYFLRHDRIAFEKGVSRTIEYIKMPNGEDKIIDTHKIRFYDKNGDAFIFGIARDVTQRERLLGDIQKANKTLEYIAYNDDLAEVFNRKGFIKNARHALKDNADDKLMALLNIDLDNFKYINDTLGYSFGDKLITGISQRLKAILDNSAIIGRSGGDDFIVLIQGVSYKRQIYQLAEQLINKISEIYIIDDKKVFQSCSIGVSIYPNDADNIEKLLQYADTAMHIAKSKGKNTYELYNAEFDNSTKRRNAIDKELRNLDTNEFHIVYQPQYNRNKNIYGVEALLRWNSPVLGNITPDEFIPLAEKNQMIKELGHWIFTQTIKDWQELSDENLVDNLKLSINISSVQLLEESFSGNIIKNFGQIEKQDVTFEITETHLLNNVDLTRSIIANINKLGISFALDDFGTGYSSLKYLANLPIDYLKIDKGFVQNLDKQNNKGIVLAIVELAKNLGKHCVAEGVETIEQLQFLESIGCDYYQGYYFSRPISLNDLKNLLKSK